VGPVVQYLERLGVQYKYNKYRATLEALSTELGGEMIYKGFQVFLSFQF
jgi:hypothetical protein